MHTLGVDLARSSPSIGRRLGAYVLVRPLARGGMGEVWEAAHAETGGRYALKTLFYTLPVKHPIAMSLLGKVG